MFSVLLYHGQMGASGGFLGVSQFFTLSGFLVMSILLQQTLQPGQALSLRDFWGGLPRAHRATTFPGFPNFFMLEGPTGVFGNTSVIEVTEYQLVYLLDYLNKIRDDKLAAIAPSREAYGAVQHRPQ